MWMRKNFPSLNALVVLEAAVRHRGFTAAAVELGVTQAAVSRQIAALEAGLDTLLFVRKHRTVEPTPQCQLLAASLAVSFANIAESVEVARSTRRQDAVTVGATLAVSTFWLLPRLSEFRAQYPAAQIRVMSQDSRFNLSAGDVDVIVRYGVPPFDDGVVMASRSDEVFPVCSPDYLARSGVTEQAFLAGKCDLIDHDVPDRSWYAWHDWFGRAGVPASRARPSLRFNYYTEAIQAARGGHGVAMGWGLLAQGDLAEGALVRLGDKVVAAEGRYNVVVPARRKLNPMRDIFIEWLAASLSR